MNIFKIPSKKYAKQSLMSLYGVSNCTANKMLGILRLHPNALDSFMRRKQLEDIANTFLSSMKINFRLRLIIFSRLCLLITINSYRGLRMLQGLPTRGQRTHANAKSLSTLRKSGKFFPFKISIRKTQDNEVKTKKLKKAKTAVKKITTKQKAKTKAKNKAKAKAKKKAKK
jgi:small subunit ribosomal protein S13